MKEIRTSRKPGSPPLAETLTGDGPGSVQLKRELHGSTYAEQSAALQPPGPYATTVQAKEAEAEEVSDEEQELKDKVAALVAKDHGGDYAKAFAHYAGADGVVDRKELVKLLKDASVGNGLTRGVWADEIIKRFDTDGSGTISDQEFLTKIS